MTVGRIPVIEGGIQPTIFDAKGDLLTATANDTPARLAVGTNGEMLVADSTAATGLDWKTAAEQYPWTSFTPSTNNITVGNGSRVGRYQQIGKTVHCYFNFTFGTTSAFTGQISFNVPVTPSASLAYATLFYGTAYDYGAASYPLSWTMVGGTVYGAPTNASGTYAQATPDVNATVPFTFGNLDSVSAYITYEAA